MFYELRRYDVMPGKFPALLHRFETFTTKKWLEYDIRMAGFWTPEMGSRHNQVIYAFAWKSMEERLARLGKWQASAERAEKWKETEREGPLVRRVNNMLLEPTAFCQLEAGIPYGPSAASRAPYLFELRECVATAGKMPALLQRFGGVTTRLFSRLGFRQVGYWTPIMGGHNHLLIYLLAWESYDERNRRFAEFREDPEHRRAIGESEKSGPLIESVTNTMLRPTSFSTLK